MQTMLTPLETFQEVEEADLGEAVATKQSSVDSEAVF